MKPLKKKTVPRPSLATQLARHLIENALRVTARTASKRLVVILVAPSALDLDVYEAAASVYLGDLLAAGPGGTVPHHVQSETRDPASRLDVYSMVSHVLLVVPDAAMIDAQARMMADHIVHLPPLTLDDVRTVARQFCRARLKDADAELLAGQTLVTIARAFPAGRAFATGLRKLRDYVRELPPTAGARKPTAKSRNDRSLADLPGFGDAKLWGLRLAADIAAYREGSIDWAAVDRGIVLSGPPGVGKTVFARALAVSCDLPLVHASASRWQSHGHLGDTLKAMRHTFSSARENSPCILFIDELDSFPNRETEKGENASYYTQYVNGFLECLDGSEQRDGVVVVAATNRIDIIDPALLRSGRFERVVEIGLPDTDARNEILRLNLPDLQPGRSIVFDLATEGWSGADVERLARDVAREHRIASRRLDFVLVEQMLPALHEIDEGQLYRVAVHEAGHALVARMLYKLPVTLLAVNRYLIGKAVGNRSLGHINIVDHPATIRTRKWYEDRIAIAMAGVAAETVFFGDHSDGAGGSDHCDLALARDLATSVVSVYGMDSTWLCETDLRTTGRPNIGTEHATRERVENIIRTGFERALACAQVHSNTLERIARAAVAHGSLDGDQIEMLMRARSATTSNSPQ